MVNLTKRMHRLMPLWSVKSGAGAAILPPKPPAPQLVHLHLHLPNPCSGFDAGARKFWKIFLPSLKYHNLTVPMVVEQALKPGPSFIPTLTLKFESAQREVLEQMQTTPSSSDSEALEAARRQFDLEYQRARAKAIEAGQKPPERKVDGWQEVLKAEQQTTGIPGGSGTKIDAVEIKAQPAANPSTPSSTNAPTTMYTRTVRLGLRGRSAGDIWSWFKHATKARQFYRSKEDKAQVGEYDKFFQKAQVDRERLKAATDAVKREKEDLRRAREAADRLAAEA